MARYIEHKRDTELFVSGSLDHLLPEGSVARAIWAGLERLDFGAYDAAYRNDAAGRSALNPRCLTAVWMLGMLRGITSSVRLAERCSRDIEFRWLLGDAPVEKSTLCEFRKTHREALLSLSTQVLSALGRNGLLPGEHLGVDGTIVRAASSRRSVKSRKRLEAGRKRLEDLLRGKLSEPDTDTESAEVKSLERRRRRLERALDEMDRRGLREETKRLTVTEPDARQQRQKDGSYAPGYNAQTVTDLDTGAILHAEVVDAGNDSGQLQPQVERAQEVLQALGAGGVRAVVADGEYHDTLQLEELEKRGVPCYVPDGNAHRTPTGVAPEYRAEAFAYDEESDTMCCPQGQTMQWRKRNNGKTWPFTKRPRACAARARPKRGVARRAKRAVA